MTSAYSFGRKSASNFLYLRLLAHSKRLHVFRKDEKEKRLTSFDLLYLTAVRGRSYAEGAQRDSGAIPLRVPATGGVLPYDLLLSPHILTEQSRGFA